MKGSLLEFLPNEEENNQKKYEKCYYIFCCFVYLWLFGSISYYNLKCGNINNTTNCPNYCINNC